MNSTGFDPKYLKGGDTPWVPFTPYNEKVGIKLLHVDQARGEMALLMRVPAGTYLGATTTAAAWCCTRSGWLALHGARLDRARRRLCVRDRRLRHSFQGEAGEDAELFVLLDGSLEFLDEAGNIAAIEDWRSMLDRLAAHCKANGIAVPELTEFPIAHGWPGVKSMTLCD